uniref:Uncharacterized protein n=1 Tax=Photinus pyralis TaxID=7054 RepID=A0A1Y1N7X5_PHOPY
MLRQTVEANHRNWAQLLPKVACAIRSAKHEVLDNSPYFVNFGREMNLDGNSNNFQNEEDDLDIKRRMGKASDKMEQKYNLRRRDEQFIVGQQVYRKNYVLSDASKYFTAKLAPKYIGPFIIHKRLNPWTLTNFGHF